MEWRSNIRSTGAGTVYKPELKRFAETDNPEGYVAEWCRFLCEQKPLKHAAYVLRYHGIWHRLDLEDLDDKANVHMLIMKPPADTWPYRAPDTPTKCMGRLDFDASDAEALCRDIITRMDMGPAPEGNGQVADSGRREDAGKCLACVRLKKDPDVQRAFS